MNTRTGLNSSALINRNELLRFRSDLLQALRNYFYETGAVEVTTPTLGEAGVSDVHLDNLTVELGDSTGYLQTSPEYAMKVLLAEYCSDLFQICPAYRGRESGPQHRVEFTMLEWYRVDTDLISLMEDVSRLWQHLHDTLSPLYDMPGWHGLPLRCSYLSLWQQHISINPHAAALEQLVGECQDRGAAHINEFSSRADCLDALFATQVEPKLDRPMMVYDFPACQAALAETGLDDQGHEVSRRFELYVGGVELANAYQELTEPHQLRQRFADNNERRKLLGKPEVADDQQLLAAMNDLPKSAGIALGVDRLAMCLLAARSLAEVTP